MVEGTWSAPRPLHRSPCLIWADTTTTTTRRGLLPFALYETNCISITIVDFRLSTFVFLTYSAFATLPFVSLLLLFSFSSPLGIDSRSRLHQPESSSFTLLPNASAPHVIPAQHPAKQSKIFLCRYIFQNTFTFPHSSRVAGPQQEKFLIFRCSHRFQVRYTTPPRDPTLAAIGRQHHRTGALQLQPFAARIAACIEASRNRPGVANIPK